MGATVAKLMPFGIGREIKIVMLGFKGAGKSTMLKKFNLGTVEHNGTVESVQYKKLSITALDLSPEDDNEKDHLLKRYGQKANGIIFVVDSVDRENFSKAKTKLQKMINEDPISRSKVLLVCANKQDSLDATNISEIKDGLDLPDLKCPWYVQSTCATTGQGLYEGLGWLISTISTNKS